MQRCSFALTALDVRMVEPVQSLDQLNVPEWSRGSALAKVPVVRLFGISRQGASVCAHVHGCWPFFYVELSEEAAARLGSKSHSCTEELMTEEIARPRELAAAIEDAAQRARPAKPVKVVNLRLERWRSIYGLRITPSPFLRVELTDARDVEMVAGLLQSNEVEAIGFAQAHEAHLPFLLHFLAEHHLSGAGLCRVSGTERASRLSRCALELDVVAPEGLVNSLEYRELLRRAGQGSEARALSALRSQLGRQYNQLPSPSAGHVSVSRPGAAARTPAAVRHALHRWLRGGAAPVHEASEAFTEMAMEMANAWKIAQEKVQAPEVLWGLMGRTLKTWQGKPVGVDPAGGAPLEGRPTAAATRLAGQAEGYSNPADDPRSKDHSQEAEMEIDRGRSLERMWVKKYHMMTPGLRPNPINWLVIRVLTLADFRPRRHVGLGALNWAGALAAVRGQCRPGFAKLRRMTPAAQYAAFFGTDAEKACDALVSDLLKDEDDAGETDVPEERSGEVTLNESEEEPRVPRVSGVAGAALAQWTARYPKVGFQKNHNSPERGIPPKIQGPDQSDLEYYFGSVAARGDRGDWMGPMGSGLSAEAPNSLSSPSYFGAEQFRKNLALTLEDELGPKVPYRWQTDQLAPMRGARKACEEYDAWLAQLPSIGSANHFFGTCDRCCFHPKGRCHNGYNCQHCHYDHEKRKRKSKKKSTEREDLAHSIPATPPALGLMGPLEHCYPIPAPFPEPGAPVPPVPPGLPGLQAYPPWYPEPVPPDFIPPESHHAPAWEDYVLRLEEENRYLRGMLMQYGASLPPSVIPSHRGPQPMPAIASPVDPVSLNPMNPMLSPSAVPFCPGWSTDATREPVGGAGPRTPCPVYLRIPPGTHRVDSEKQASFGCNAMSLDMRNLTDTTSYNDEKM
ncbi:DNA polymerase zeta catalytic subunit (Protein reversionless 3) [Durusdinium trenchii]|uniref:DNA polymerase zeta catalytic subunit (Protein reversionless 3) n=1 Tax=Durusdinium trenchii TaxID=1381693 RepID=A0ABP0HZV8_9DINO